MKKLSIIPAICCALLSTTALAGELVIDLANPTDETSFFASNTPGSFNAPLLDVKLNLANINTEVGSNATIPLPSLNAPLVLGDVDGSSQGFGYGISDGNGASASVGVNTRADADGNYVGNNQNVAIFEEGGSLAAAEAIIGSANYNNGVITTYVYDVNQTINANALTNGAEIGARNETFDSLVVINGQENTITGDVGSREPGSDATTPGATIDQANTSNGVEAQGDIVIAAFQGNADTGVSDSYVQDVDKTINVDSLDASSSMANQNLNFVAENEVNFLVNTVDLTHLGTELDIAVAALQVNAATADTSVEDIYLTMNVSGAVLGDMTNSDLEFKALTSVNDMTNLIRSESGSAEGNIFAHLVQDNDGAVTGYVSNVNVDMNVGTAGTSTSAPLTGNMTIRDLEFVARAGVNNAYNWVGTDSSGDGLIEFKMDQDNSGAVSATITTVDMSIDAVDSTATAGTALGSGGSMSVNNIDAIAYAFANVMTNIVTGESSGSGPIDLDYNQANSGAINVTAEYLNVSLDASVGAMAGSMEIAHIDVSSLAYANVMTNQISNAGNGGRDIDLKVQQENAATITATGTELDGSMNAGGGDMSGSMKSANNNVTSFAYANILTNQISNTGSGGQDIDLDVLQDNSSAVTATANNVDFSMTGTPAGGTTSGDMSVLNNTVTANALVNSMYNDITVGASSSASNVVLAQVNAGAVTARITSANMGISAPGTMTGTAGIRNNRVSATSIVNSATNILRLQ